MRCCSTRSVSPTAGPTCSRRTRTTSIGAINMLEPTTNLLLQVQPRVHLPAGGREDPARQRRLCRVWRKRPDTASWTSALLLGNDPYHYPDNLPVVGAKGGPGGKPGCGSLPDAAKNFPVRQLVTNTGWGTGLDMRPNPGIGIPGLGQLLPGHPRGARAAQHPQLLRRAGDRADPVSGGAALRRGAVRAGRHAAVAGAATGAAPDGAEDPGPRPGPSRSSSTRRRDAADTATADPVAARGRAGHHDRYRESQER